MESERYSDMSPKDRRMMGLDGDDVSAPEAAIEGEPGESEGLPEDDLGLAGPETGTPESIEADTESEEQMAQAALDAAKQTEVQLRKEYMDQIKYTIALGTIATGTAILARALGTENSPVDVPLAMTAGGLTISAIKGFLNSENIYAKLGALKDKFGANPKPEGGVA